MPEQSVQPEQTVLPDKMWYTPEEFADLIGEKKEMVDQWRYRGSKGPKYYKIGGKVKYKFSDIQAWLKASERETVESLATSTDK